MAKSRTCTPFSSRGRTGVLSLASQMVNHSGLLLKAAHPTPRITSIHMTRLVPCLVLVLLCTMVAATIMAALHLSKPRNTVITRQIRRILSQILMAIGGKGHFTTKQELGVLSLPNKEMEGGGVEPNFLDSSYLTIT